MKTLSIIIVNWNTSEYLVNCLNSIEKHLKNKTDYEIFVFDNNSADNSVDILKKEFQQVKLFTSETNIGFGSANNVLLNSCNSKYTLILNPDILFIDGSFVNMIKYNK